MKKIFGVEEFHLEDLNPTIDKKRMQNLAEEIIKKKLKIIWKIGSGTKIETVDEETLTIMAKSGCTFLSLSPETGSIELLKKMNKPFNHERALELVKHMNSLNMTTQACFVLGYPEETETDRALTYQYCKKLAKAGCDEIALFIMAPVPGASTYQNYKEKILQKNKQISLQDMSFSPKWREDYNLYKKFRLKTYVGFMVTKMFYHPLKTLQQPWNIICKKFKTKMEMTIFRIGKTYILQWKKKKNILVLFWIIFIFTIYYLVRIIDILQYINKI
jgi:radical SAM superfamily enzyme YgiQ (UPF0313 family)